MSAPEIQAAAEAAARLSELPEELAAPGVRPFPAQEILSAIHESRKY